MGEVVGETCGYFCGAVALTTTAAISHWCNQTACGLTLCRCCDRLCLCGCCWKGSDAPLPEEDYPGGANHPDTIAVRAKAERQARGEDGDGTGAPPPPYDAAGSTATTEQPRAQPAMSVAPATSAVEATVPAPAAGTDAADTASSTAKPATTAAAS